MVLSAERRKDMMKQEKYVAGLYCRLSRDDCQPGESVSIGTQRSMLLDFCEENGYEVINVYVDDGYSGLNFERPGFKYLLNDIEQGKINMVITKDLSRLGRDYIMTGYYSEIFFPSNGVRYIAMSDNFDSNKLENNIAPFLNILNDMYAKDISKKIKNAKHQRAKDGAFIGGVAPYGYKKAHDSKYRLVINEETAAVVRKIYDLALAGNGAVNIAKQLAEEQIIKPSAYNGIKYHGKSLEDYNKPYEWSTASVLKILKSRVYRGDMVSLRTETVNYKTRVRKAVPPDEQIITADTHQAIISPEEFERVQQIINQHNCPADYHRETLFRRMLYCSECGHAMSAAYRRLTYTEDDSYRCTHHFTHPDECKMTHAIYHKPLYNHVLNEIRTLGKTMKRRKINSPIAEYADIDELTPEILQSVIRRIEIDHVGHKSKMSKVVHIEWTL